MASLYSPGIKNKHKLEAVKNAKDTLIQYVRYSGEMKKPNSKEVKMIRMKELNISKSPMRSQTPE